MPQDTAALYRAYAARDPRFDGVFFIGVTSTGIYCRPVCTARTPKAANCRFFDSAEAAEKASFRPCLRCRPELAPGNAPVDDAQRIAALVARRIEEGALDDGARLGKIAKEFGWSARQIRRIVHRELGVSPMELVLTRRLLLAKQLLTETTLPITEVAFASGFASVRRFNDAFGERYGIPPSHFRRVGRGFSPAMVETKRISIAPNDGGAEAPPYIADTFTLRLSYRPPYDWAGVLAFLRARTLAGVERVDEDAYLRTVRLGEHTGWVRVRHAPAQRGITVELTHSLTPALPALLGRLRNVFDLAARPDMIAERLGTDETLAPLVARNPGVRIPGAFDGFELAVRAILGQQISVKAATTLAGRFTTAFGDPMDTPHDGLVRLTPTPERIAAARVDDIASLGVVSARARAIVALAEAMASGELRLEPGLHPDTTIAQLVALPGIGPWTAHYIAMRALRWPDAFPREDAIIRQRLGGVTPARAEALAEAWRPWRGYGVLLTWGAPG
jgi:AraC family transcriptional regulator of adaptative response / DNA-3-methyladenine glycosylase II